MIYFLPRLKRRLHGFTLVELLVVIAVISVLTTVGISLINPVKQINRANDSRRKSDLLSIQTALERFYADNGDYPGSAFWCTQISSTGFPQVKDALSPDYMNALPRDPKYSSTTDYFYWHTPGQYRLYAVLDDTSDPAVTADVQTADGLIGTCAGASSSYNYRLTNP